MILFDLNSLYRKELRRHPMYGLNKKATMVTTVSLAIIIVCFLMYGFLIALYIHKLFPAMSSIQAVSQFIPYALLCDLMMRNMLQLMPAWSMAPYLSLPIRRKYIYHFLLIRSFYNKFNLYLLPLVFSFLIVGCVMGNIEILPSIAYFIGFLLLIGINNLLSFLIQRLSTIYSAVSIGFFVIILTSGAISFLQSDAVFQFSARMGMAMSEGWALLPIMVVVVLLYFLNIYLLEKTFMLQMEKEEKTKVKENLHLSFLDRLGELGLFIRLEMSVLLRGKIKQILWSILILFAYLCFQLYQHRGNPSVFNMSFFFIVLVLSQMPLTLTISGLGYEGSFFDLLLMHPLSINKVIKAKYVACLLFVLLLVLPLGIIYALGWISGWMLLAAFFYAIGIQIPLYMITIPFVKIRRSETKAPQSSTFTVVLLVIIFMILSVVGILSSRYEPSLVYATITGVSALSVVASPLWLKLLCQMVDKRKEEIAMSFRQ